VAQIGAAIGREFSHALVDAVMRKPEAELASALDRLVAAGLLFRQGGHPHATYLFKHALLRDAAYGCLLRSQRQALHARIGSTLEGQFPDVVEHQPATLAQHWTEAGSIERAIAYWTKAGQMSVVRVSLWRRQSCSCARVLRCSLALSAHSSRGQNASFGWHLVGHSSF
jgi:predicted ATPase